MPDVMWIHENDFAFPIYSLFLLSSYCELMFDVLWENTKSSTYYINGDEDTWGKHEGILSWIYRKVRNINEWLKLHEWSNISNIIWKGASDKKDLIPFWSFFIWKWLKVKKSIYYSYSAPLHQQPVGFRGTSWDQPEYVPVQASGSQKPMKSYKSHTRPMLHRIQCQV